MSTTQRLLRPHVYTYIPGYDNTHVKQKEKHTTKQLLVVVAVVIIVVHKNIA